MASQKKPAAPVEKAQAAKTVATAKSIQVISSVEGFRRGGRAWSRTATIVALDELTKEQLAQIRTESVLTVEDIGGESSVTENTPLTPAPAAEAQKEVGADNLSHESSTSAEAA